MVEYFEFDVTETSNDLKKILKNFFFGQSSIEDSDLYGNFLREYLILNSISCHIKDCLELIKDINVDSTRIHFLHDCEEFSKYRLNLNPNFLNDQIEV